MTRVDIKITADMRVATRAPEHYERIAEVIERELRALDSSLPTLGRPGDLGPAEVTHIFVQTEHRLGLGRVGRGDGWASASDDQHGTGQGGNL